MGTSLHGQCQALPSSSPESGIFVLDHNRPAAGGALATATVKQARHKGGQNASSGIWAHRDSRRLTTCSHASILGNSYA